MSDEWHGTVGGYCNHACRCDACKSAKRDAFAASRRQAQGFRRARMPQKAHGTLNGYSYWGCRCDQCKAVTAERARLRYHARKAAVTS